MRHFPHPSERGFDFAHPGTSRLAQSRLIESATRCQLFGIGESSSSSSTVDARTVADNAADLTNITSANKSNIAADGSTLVQGSNIAGLFTGSNVGAGSTIAGGDLTNTLIDLANARIGDETNLDLAGARVGDDNSTDLANARIGSTEIGSISIQDNSPQVLAAALDKVSEFAALSEASRQAANEGLLSFAKLSEQGRSAAEAATGEKLSSLLDAQAAAEQKTDKDSQSNRTVLFIVLALLAFLFFRR